MPDLLGPLQDHNTPMSRIAISAALVSCLAAGVTGEPAASVAVIAHSPGQNEADVRLDTPIRVQFSADIDPSTLEGQITLAYSAEDSKARGEPEPPRVAYQTEYVAPERTLIITPIGGWLRFREVRLMLDEGIRGADGAPLEPFALRFTTGGQ